MVTQITTYNGVTYYDISKRYKSVVRAVLLAGQRQSPVSITPRTAESMIYSLEIAELVVDQGHSITIRLNRQGYQLYKRLKRDYKGKQI